MHDYDRNITKEINGFRLRDEILEKTSLASYQNYNRVANDFKFFFDGALDAQAEADLDLVISLHDASPTTKEALMEQYRQREVDGVDYYNSVRTDIMLLYLAGSITVLDALYIETKYSHAKELIRSGDWLTAQAELANVVVEGALTQEIYDDIKAGIDQYVLDNY